jgi:hypothetical protein
MVRQVRPQLLRLIGDDALEFDVESGEPMFYWWGLYVAKFMQVLPDLPDLGPEWAIVDNIDAQTFILKSLSFRAPVAVNHAVGKGYSVLHGDQITADIRALLGLYARDIKLCVSVAPATVLDLISPYAKSILTSHDQICVHCRVLRCVCKTDI